MSNRTEGQIVEAEERLRGAMLGSDVEALDALLTAELIFSNHLGTWWEGRMIWRRTSPA